MPFRPLRNLPIDELEEALRNAQAELMAGKTTNSWGAGDSSAGHAVQRKILDRIFDIQLELWHQDPANYAKPVRRTVTTARFIAPS